MNLLNIIFKVSYSLGEFKVTYQGDFRVALA